MFGSIAARTTAGLAVFLALVLGLGWVEFERRTTPPRAIEVLLVPGVPKPASPSVGPTTAPAPAASTASAPPGEALSGQVSSPAQSALPVVVATKPAEPPPAPAPVVDMPAAVSPSPASSPPLSGTETPEAAAALRGPMPARFDVVRVDAGGGVVVAGRSQAGSRIELLAGDRLIDSTVADAAGQWVMVPGTTLPPGSHELALRTGIAAAPPEASRQTVSVVVPPSPAGQSRVVVNEPGKPPVGTGTEIAAVPSPGGEAMEMRPADAAMLNAVTTPAPEPLATAETQTAALPPRPATAGEPERVEGAAAPADASASRVVIDTLDAAGTRFAMQGRGPAGAPLRIYFNGTMVAEPIVGSDGTWSLEIKQGFISGEYRIRIEQVQSNGSVVASIDRVMEHKAPTVVAQAQPAPPPPVGSPASTAPAMRSNPPPAAVEPGLESPATPGEPALGEPPRRAPAPTADAPAADMPPSAPSPDAPTPNDPIPNVPAPNAKAPGAPAPQASTGQAITGASAADAGAPSSPPAASGETAAAASSEPVDGSHVVIPKLSTVQVRRGESLWVLSRRAYGRGKMYGVIYKANRDRIRVPRLIYPKQVLVMPPREPS